MRRGTLPGLGSCPVLFNKKQIAARYGVSVSCINKWMKQGLPYLRLRYKTVRFNPVICDAALCQPHGKSQPRLRRRRAPTSVPLPPIQMELSFSCPDQPWLWPEMGEKEQKNAA